MLYAKFLHKAFKIYLKIVNLLLQNSNIYYQFFNFRFAVICLKITRFYEYFFIVCDFSLRCVFKFFYQHKYVNFLEFDAEN